MPRRRVLRSVDDDNCFESEIFKGDNEKETVQDNDDSSDLSDGDLTSENDESSSESSDSDENENIDRNQRLSTDQIDDDEDDMPEAVSFRTSKHSVLDSFKNVQRHIDEVKEKSKMKRRQQDEKYKEQKKRKLDELAKKKLPEDFFDELPDEIPKNDQKKKLTVQNRKDDMDDDEEEEASLADTEEDFGTNSEDFIPLDDNRLSGGLVATTVKLYHKDKCKSSADKAADFKNRLLFGNRIPRESSKTKLAKLTKKKVFVSR